MARGGGRARGLIAQRGVPWRLRLWARRLRVRFPVLGDLAEVLRTAWASFLFYSGLLALIRLLLRERGGAVILAYHGVGDRSFLPDGMVLTPERFEAHLRYLQRHRIVASLESILELLERGETPHGDMVAITFDDGYKNNHTVALPLLRKHDCAATVFVCTGPLDKGESQWPVKLFYWLHLTTARTLPLDWPRRGPAQVFDLASPRGRRRAAEALPWLLRRMPTGEREAMQRRLAGQLGVDPAQDPRSLVPMLTWDQVRALATSGICIGAHTQTHPALSAALPEEVAGEVAGSKAALERELGRPVTLFAYPFGREEDVGVAVQQAVRAAGFRAACSTVPGRNRAGSNLYALHRIVVKDWSVPRLALELARAS